MVGACDAKVRDPERDKVREALQNAPSMIIHQDSLGRVGLNWLSMMGLRCSANGNIPLQHLGTAAAQFQAMERITDCRNKSIH